MVRLLDTNVDAIERSSTSLHMELGQFNTPWHSHNKRHQLLYPTGGVLHVHTESARMLLPARHGALIPAGVRHRLESSAASMMLRTIYFGKQGNDPPVFGQLQIFPVDKLGQEMIAYTSRWHEHDSESGLEQQMIKTLRLLVNEWCHEELHLRLPSTQHQRLNRIVEEIHSNLDGSILLRDLAPRYGFSVRSLIRLFYQELGMTFGQYKKMARMIRATELLGNTQMSITEVMSHVGYESQSSFSRNFKDSLGVRPSEFVKANAG